MNSRAGWIVVGYLYSRLQGLAPHKHPLETVFLLKYRELQYATLLESRAQIQAFVTLIDQTGGGPDGAKAVIAAYKEYVDRMLPNFGEASTAKSKYHQLLDQFVQHRAKLDLSGLLQQRIVKATKATPRRKMGLRAK